MLRLTVCHDDIVITGYDNLLLNCLMIEFLRIFRVRVAVVIDGINSFFQRTRLLRDDRSHVSKL